MMKEVQFDEGAAIGISPYWDITHGEGFDAGGLCIESTETV